jgi:DNA-directed RNA polymerase I, II, and III subunit RPABC2
MDTEEIIESGGDYENYDEDIVGVIDLEETTISDVKPELKKLYQQHPECVLDYIENVIPKIPLQIVPPIGEKSDANHRTYPFLTLYEKTKIIGLRANQISKGSAPFITVPEHITSVKDIARMELEQKRLPFIVKRPLPDGTFEYWRLSDLMIL